MPDPLGALFKHHRAINNLRLGDVAERLGVATPRVSCWENGYERPDAALTAKVFEAYGFTSPELVKAALLLWDHVPALDKPVNGTVLHVSWAHDATLGEACSCHECRHAWYAANACPTCHGEGLKPGVEKPDDPREVARLEALFDHLKPRPSVPTAEVQP